jgi:2-polyprenyl-3-methyl-5-hydroxy-6-metoxy-1,4-benzoquinol methylase
MNQEKIWHYFQNESLETMQNSEERLRYLSRRVLRRTKPGAKVLNVGIGPGLFEKMAMKLGLDVYSLDPDQEAINRLNEQAGMKGQARVGYLQSMPFDQGFFEAVVISEVLEHLSDEALEKALGEIQRVLQSGGLIIGTVPAREVLTEQLAVCPHCGEKFHRWGHLQSFDEERMRRLLSKYFRAAEIKEKHMDSWSRLNWKGKMFSLTIRLMLSFGVRGSGNSLYFLARKH